MKIRIHAGTFVVVCDGAKALVLENVGDEVFPNLATREVLAQDNPPTREQGTDRPGKVQSAAYSGRSAVETTDWHDEAEKRFLADLAARLHEAVLAGRMKKIVLAAPPRALGVLRHALSKNAAAAVIAEIDKDYVALPVGEIEKRVAAG
jgi:protein required for attachment to host cells